MSNESKLQLIDLKKLAEVLGVSYRTAQRFNSQGMFPSSIRINKMQRWKLEDIKNWIDRGCNKE